MQTIQSDLKERVYVFAQSAGLEYKIIKKEHTWLYIGLCKYSPPCRFLKLKRTKLGFIVMNLHKISHKIEVKEKNLYCLSNQIYIKNISLKLVDLCANLSVT